MTQTLSMERFWRWLGAHYNCILRAGGPGFSLFDQPDVHWHLGEDPDGHLVVQLIRGKELCAEMFVNPADVVLVQSSPGDEEEQTLFECIGGPEGQTGSLCHFLMAHPWDEEEAPDPGRWTH